MNHKDWHGNDWKLPDPSAGDTQPTKDGILRNFQIMLGDVWHPADEEWLSQALDTYATAKVEEEREKIKADYIEWVLASSYGPAKHPYRGATPFGEWRDAAEAKDMTNWK